MSSANHHQRNRYARRHQNDPYAAVVLRHYDYDHDTGNNHRQVALQLSRAAIGESSQTHKMDVPRRETCPFSSSVSQKKEDQIPLPKWTSFHNVTENEETTHQPIEASDDYVYYSNVEAAENADSGDGYYHGEGEERATVFANDQPPCDLSFIDPAVLQCSTAPHDSVKNRNNNNDLSLSTNGCNGAGFINLQQQQQHSFGFQNPQEQQQDEGSRLRNVVCCDHPGQYPQQGHPATAVSAAAWATQEQSATAGKQARGQHHQQSVQQPLQQEQFFAPLNALTNTTCFTPLSCIGTVNTRTYHQQQQQQPRLGHTKSNNNNNNNKQGRGRPAALNRAKVANPHAPRVALEGDDDCEAAYWRATRAIVDQSTVGSLIVKHRANPSTSLKDMISRIEGAMRDRDGGTNVFRGVHIIRCYLEVKILFQSKEEAEAGKSLVSRHPEWFGN